MKVAREFVDSLAACGVVLTAKGKNVEYTAPSGAMTPDLKAELAKRKPAILAVLYERTPPAQVDEDFYGKLVMVVIHYAPPTEWLRLLNKFKRVAMEEERLGYERNPSEQIAFNAVELEVRGLTGKRAYLTFPDAGPVGFEMIEDTKPQPATPPKATQTTTAPREHQTLTQGALNV